MSVRATTRVWRTAMRLNVFVAQARVSLEYSHLPTNGVDGLALFIKPQTSFCVWSVPVHPLGMREGPVAVSAYENSVWKGIIYGADCCFCHIVACCSGFSLYNGISRSGERLKGNGILIRHDYLGRARQTQQYPM